MAIESTSNQIAIDCNGKKVIVKWNFFAYSKYLDEFEKSISNGGEFLAARAVKIATETLSSMLEKNGLTIEEIENLDIDAVAGAINKIRSWFEESFNIMVGLGKNEKAVEEKQGQQSKK